MNIATRITVCALLTLLSSCATVAGLPDLPKGSDQPYRLGPGDTLQISVFGEADLTGSYPVSASGAVNIPLVGMVPASGLTVTELQQSLVEQLNAKAVRSPNVTVWITTYRPFFILGEVKNPGAYPYLPNMTVLSAVAIAGGFTYRAAKDQISVVRVQANGRPVESRALRDSRILPGDVINIFERHL